jgi:hypothetical protein
MTLNIIWYIIWIVFSLSFLFSSCIIFNDWNVYLRNVIAFSLLFCPPIFRYSLARVTQSLQYCIEFNYFKLTLTDEFLRFLYLLILQALRAGLTLEKSCSAFDPSKVAASILKFYSDTYQLLQEQVKDSSKKEVTSKINRAKDLRIIKLHGGRNKHSSRLFSFYVFIFLLF